MVAMPRNRGKRRLLNVSVEESSSSDRAEEMLMNQREKNHGPSKGNRARI
jgi:hypothetical protein